MEHRLHIILNTAGCTERCLWPPCFACRDFSSPSRTLSWLGFCLRVIGHHALACALAESTDEAWTASLALCLCKAAFQHTGRDCHYEVASSPKHDLIHSYRLHHFQGLQPKHCPEVLSSDPSNAKADLPSFRVQPAERVRHSSGCNPEVCRELKYYCDGMVILTGKLFFLVNAIQAHTYP